MYTTRPSSSRNSLNRAVPEDSASPKLHHLIIAVYWEMDEGPRHRSVAGSLAEEGLAQATEAGLSLLHPAGNSGQAGDDVVDHPQPD